MSKFSYLCAAIFTAGLIGSAALADDPEIIDVKITKFGMDWRVDVTLLHPDSGWDHYADGWEVLDADGNQIGYRKLHHPHENEQPFTRSLSNIMIPDGTYEIYVRARCSVDNWASETTHVSLEP